jgi:hypothetical protein
MDNGLLSAPQFGSAEQAVAALNNPAYQEALKALGNACERDVRIVGGVDLRGYGYRPSFWRFGLRASAIRTSSA